jgi:hypothetical protein
MQWWIISTGHQLSTCMTANMNLRRGALESVPWMSAFSALFTWTLIIRSWQVRTSSNKSSSPSPFVAFWWRIWNYGFCFDCLLPVNLFSDIDRIMPKDIFLSGLLFLLVASFLLRMRLKIVLNDTVKNWVSNSWSHIFSTSDTLLLLGFNKVSQASSAKPMIARLNTYRNVHDFKTKRTRNLLLKRFGQIICLVLLLLFFLLLFLFLLLLFGLFLRLLLKLLLFLAFFLLSCLLFYLFSFE